MKATIGSRARTNLEAIPPRTRGSAGRPRRTIATAVAGMLVAMTSVAFAASPASADVYDPAADMNSMYNTTLYSGAAAWWNAGYTGAGVDVAVIDTGVAPVPGLNAPGKVIHGPDLSLESQAPQLTRLDTNGHGTFMAGLIAGHDSTLTAPYASAPASAYRGMAPDARIVSLKVGVADGGVDVSQVIAAINWVIQHRRDNGMNIRIINLSYGTNSVQDYTIDPLAYAVEQAFFKGILVVAAGGNNGFQRHSNNAPALSDPAYDPYVLAVGSSDSMGTATVTDDQPTVFSPWPKRGSTRGVDLVAPGAHLQGLRVPGSAIDQSHPEGLIDSRYFRGSGTSQSAAIVSGAAALVMQKYPDASPGQVKKILKKGCYTISGKSQAIGTGEMQLEASLTIAPSNVMQFDPVSLGTGSLEAARGEDHISDDGVVLSGEIDIFGHPYDSVAMAAAMAAGTSWSGGIWNGNTWSGAAWTGNTWSGNTWSGNSWSGNTWSGNTWSGNTWSGNTWSGNTWSGNTWSGNSWSGNSWSGDSWSGDSWSGDAWSGATWG